MLYEVITEGDLLEGEKTDCQRKQQRSHSELTADQCRKGFHGEPGVFEIPEQSEIDRITSYNVCYTKLLR